MALGSTTCRGQRHGVGRGENGERNGGGERTGSTGEAGTETERLKGSRTETRRQTERGRENETVGGERSRVPGVLRRRNLRLDSALTTSGMGGTEDWSRHNREYIRPTWTWASSRRKNAQTESTPVSRPDTASSLRTRQADTAAGWPYSTDRNHFLRWRPSESTGQT